MVTFSSGYSNFMQNTWSHWLVRKKVGLVNKNLLVCKYDYKSKNGHSNIVNLKERLLS